MLIGEIAGKTGLSRDTIRFYEKEGLIKVPKKARRSNNYKEYPPQTVKRLSVIQQLKGFGLTLDEIREFIELYESDLLVCVDNIPKIREKIRMIDAKIKELRSVKQKLVDCLKDCPGECRLEKALGTLQ